ncbi:MAG: hypothetical protein JW729_09785 [Bacteroidales bacterium]|nr:hypothetical protein [Bacteroidales bacterium]
MKKFIIDQRTTTFLISLLIAFGLWLLIKISNDFQTEQDIKLVFTNYPIDKVLVNKPDSILEIKTTDDGFDIIGQMLFHGNEKINIDFSQAKHLKTQNGIQNYYILSSSLHAIFENKFKSAEQIISVRPDSILFHFENLASKKLKVIPIYEINFNPRYKAYQELKISPDSIEVFGPASELDRVQSLTTVPCKFANLSTDIDTMLRIDFLNTGLISTQKKIHLALDVEEYTEGKLKLPIQVEGKVGIHYKVFPSEVTVTYQVALKDYTKINPNSFMVKAILVPNESGKLKLELALQPKTVIVSNIYPATAEYIILK